MLGSASTDRYGTEKQLRQSELASFLPFLSYFLMFKSAFLDLFVDFILCALMWRCQIPWN